MKRKRPASPSLHHSYQSYQCITLKKAKDFIVDDIFNLYDFGLNMVIRVWQPAGQINKAIKRSYICFEGIINNKPVRYMSHQTFMAAIRKAKIHNAFDIGEFVNKQRKKICGNVCYNNNQYAQTPASIYEYLKNDLNLKIASLDPCPPNPTFDGLSEAFEWKAADDEFIYVNPPFRDALEWIQKAKKEMAEGNFKQAVFLLPARMSSPWFKLLVGTGTDNGIASHIIVSKGIRFKGYKKKMPFGCMLCICESSRLNSVEDTTIQYADKVFE